jgi:hypothetical protein
MHALRSFIIVMLLAIAVGLPMTAQPAAAADPGTIAIHSRICSTTAVQLFRDCHSKPGPVGATYKVGNRTPKTIGATGNVSFGAVPAGDRLVTLTSGIPAKYERIRAFCSNSVGGSGVHEATILVSATPQFWVRLAAGSRLTCDVYFIP